MKAVFKTDGFLHIIAETSLEVFALKNMPKDGTQIVYDITAMKKRVLMNCPNCNTDMTPGRHNWTCPTCGTQAEYDPQ